jgi:hypothetical protein
MLLLYQLLLRLRLLLVIHPLLQPLKAVDINGPDPSGSFHLSCTSRFLPVRSLTASICNEVASVNVPSCFYFQISGFCN